MISQVFFWLLFKVQVLSQWGHWSQAVSATNRQTHKNSHRFHGVLHVGTNSPRGHIGPTPTLPIFQLSGLFDMLAFHAQPIQYPQAREI